MSKWKAVFESNPEADEIYVVGDQPFVNKRHAENHSSTTKKEIETVKRGAKQEKAEPTAEELAAAEKAAADKQAKEEAKAKAAADKKAKADAKKAKAAAKK